MTKSIGADILVVDDIKDNLEIISHTLRRDDLNIHTAEDGYTALDKATTLKPDLILLDVGMPGMSGFEVCEKLKNNSQTKDIPVIFLTALSQSSDISHGFEVGAVDYITKPFNSNELRRRVKIHLQLKFSQEIIEKQNEELKRSAGYYKTIFFENNSINLLIDPENGFILDANAAACKYYGYSPSEMIGMNISDINTLDFNEIKKEMKYAKLNERNHFVFRHRLKSGTIRHVKVFSKPIKIADSEFLYSTIFDIEDKIVADKTVTKLTTAVDQSESTILITDTEGKIEYVNEHFTTLTGYTKEEVIGKNPRILKTPQTKKEVYSDLWKTIKSGKTWRGELLNKRKDGSTFWELATITPITGQNAEITNYIAIKEDITERKKSAEQLNELNRQLRISLDDKNKANQELKELNNELSKANMALKTEREQFLSLLDSIPEAIYVSDKDTSDILFTNKAMKDLFGKNIIGEKCYKVLQQNSTICNFCTNHIIFNQNEAHYWEYYNPVIKKHFYVIDRALKWTDGRKTRFELAIDITKQKESEKALQESEEKYRFMYNNVNDIICLHKPDGTYLQVSPSIEKIAGYASDDLIGKSAYNFFHPEDIKRIREESHNESLKGNAVTIRYRFRKADDNYIWLETITDVIHENGNPKYLMTSSRDVTKSIQYVEQIKKTNKALRDIQQTLAYSVHDDFYEKMVSSISSILNADITFIGEFTDDTKQRVKTLMLCKDNEIGSNIEYDLKGTPCYNVINKEASSYPKNIQKIFPKDILLQELGIEGYIGLPLFNSENVPVGIVVALYYNPINDPDFYRNILQIFSARIASEIERRKIEYQLKETNATKDKFFSIIAHDLKNPFNTILGFADLLKKKAEKLSTERLKTYIDIINDSSRSAYKLIENLLEWSRSQMGRIEFSPVYFSLNGYLKEITDVYSSYAKSKKIDIKNNVPDDIKIYADKNMLNTIIRNLLSNAIKFTNENGSVEITAKQNHNSVEVSISDTGQGISEEAVKKLFKLNERVTTKGTNNEKGTGLGLLLCKEFVEQHGGKIWIAHTDSTGSKFSFAIPNKE